MVLFDVLAEAVIEGGLAIKRTIKRQRLSKRAEREEEKLREQGGTAEDPGALNINLPEPSNGYKPDPDS